MFYQYNKTCRSETFVIYAKGGGAIALHFQRLTCCHGRRNILFHLQMARQQG